MKNNTISERQGVYLMILFCLGSSLVTGAGGKAENNSWIAVLLAAAVCILVSAMYARILGKYPEKDVYDILEEVFGKYASKLFQLPFIWFSFHLGSLVLRNFGEFLTTVGLPETPIIIPSIIFALICVAGVKSGPETISIASGYFIIFATFLIILLSLFAIERMKFENLLPILNTDLSSFMQGVLMAFTFPFGETFIFLAFFDCFRSTKVIQKIYLKALSISGVFLAMAAAINVMVLGTERNQSVYFPTYSAISRVNIGDFLQRLEIGVTIIFLLSGFVKICICLFAAVKGVTKLFGFNDYRCFATPVALLMVNLSYLLFDSIMEMIEWAEEVYPYYAIPFQVILPLIILIAAEIKSRLQKKDVQDENEAQA